MKTEQVKLWYQSKTMWGAILVLAMFVLGLFGQGHLADQLEAEQSVILDWLQQFGILIGGALACWGRLTAKKEIK